MAERRRTGVRRTTKRTVARSTTKEKTARSGKVQTLGRGKSLVIVESPAKARTIGPILGSSFVVEASLGHVRDLPKSTLGVSVDDEFMPKYLIPREKKALVNQLKSYAKTAKTVYLATDPDREGEAIAWHLVQAGEMEDRPLQRVVFHEITPEAIKEAFEHPLSINMDLVYAQQARRILDRLVGVLPESRAVEKGPQRPLRRTGAVGCPTHDCGAGARSTKLHAARVLDH